ncbi:MAG: CHAT domain-containing protein [Bacteroidota bacterium]
MSLLLAPALLAQTPDAQTPDARLLDAALAGDTTAVRLALDAGANPQATNADGVTAIMVARNAGHYDIAFTLIEVEQAREDARLGKKARRSPDPQLRQAIAANDLTAVRQALAAGASALDPALLREAERGGSVSMVQTVKLAHAEAAMTRAVELYRRGDYGDAEVVARSAVAAQQDVLSDTHPDLATSLNNLATIVEAGGDYAAARGYHERALAIREAVLPSGDPLVAQSQSNLAAVLYRIGDYAEARRLFEAALAAREATLGAAHPDVALNLNNLALVVYELDGAAAARPLAERAYALREAALGTTHPATLESMSNLAVLLTALGEHQGAVSLLERALTGYRTTFDAAHPMIATVENNLALAREQAGAPDDVLAAYERALASAENTYGPHHPQVASALNNLALARLDVASREDDSNGVEAAARMLLRAARILDRHADEALGTLSAAEQARLVETVLRPQTSLLLSAWRALTAYDRPALLAEIYPLVARWKGLLLHGLRRETAIAALADDPQYADDVAALVNVRAGLAAWGQEAETGPLEDRRARHADLTATKEALERRLARALPWEAQTDPLRHRDAPALTEVLAPGEALVDLYRYSHLDGEGHQGDYYGAVVIGAGASEPHLISFGAASLTDRDVAAWHAAASAGDAATDEVGTLVRRLWWRIATALPEGTERVWISPDAMLSRVPFALLAEEDADAGSGIPSLLVSVVASPRALVRLRQTDRTDADGLLLAGGVAFGTNAAGEALPFAPLPGTEAEVEALATIAARTGLNATVLTGAKPTAAAVRATLPGTRYVHLATHGFFEATDPALEMTSPSRSGTLGDATPEQSEPRGLARSPLVESGLAFANANAGPAGRLTAEELVGLDLSSADLVVLSACETGRGSEVVGQGVLGLQASLLAAGARGLLMSLWAVPDASTALLMERFYEGLWEQGLEPAAALRAAQRAVRAEGYVAPLHWAGWVFVGEAW